MYDPDSRREQRRYNRAQRRYYRAQRRYYRYNRPLRGLSGALFLLAIVFGAVFYHDFVAIGFLPLLFMGLAFVTLISTLNSSNRHAIYGGLQGFVWFLGLAICFWIGFWPWIFLPVVTTAVLGSLFQPIMSGLGSVSAMTAPPEQGQPYQTPASPQERTYQEQSYQEGYRAMPSQPAYQQPEQEYEQPMVQYPEEQQELPPMEQS